ncbi:MAG: valine--tRNA ligase [Candidatus Kariarchaeaceae archaeon]
MQFTSKLTEGRYKALEREEEMFKKWQEEKIYQFTDDGKPIFSIDTPPPYTNAPWHLGGAIHYSQIDMIARTMRMKGFNVLFPMGLDRNGLPVEVQAEKENKISMHQVPREEFLEMCKTLLDNYGAQVLEICHSLGFSNNSFEWDQIYKTDHPKYRAETQATFIQLFKDGLIHEDARPNNYCPDCRTTIADAEIAYKEGKTWIYDIAFKVQETDEEFIISTTRPELIPAIGFVIYHPKDEKYHHLENLHAIPPIFDKPVAIHPHHAVDQEFGTGIMMICSFGDRVDVSLFREFGIDPTYVIDVDGKMTDAAGEYSGFHVKKARKLIVAKIEELGLLRGKKEIVHRYPICDRSKTPLEFIGMPEYYLKQVDYVPKLLKYSEQLKWTPKHMKQIWVDWLNRISIDWPISRRRYYGTEVPVWYCNACKEPNLPEPGAYYQPWKDDPPFDTCQHCGKQEGFTGDLRTFDTWMDSSISEVMTIKYPHFHKDEKLFEKLIKRPYVCDIRPQGKDIVRTWLHYTMLRSEQLFGKPAFDICWISGHVVDRNGERMSKSRGNIVKPEPLIEEFGGDALRFFGALEASHGSDIRFNKQRLAGGAKFLNKLYNISRFISMFPVTDEEVELLPADKWILSELSSTLKKAYDGYEDLNFHLPARELRSFVWDVFASHYLELVKNRAYNRDEIFSTEQQRGAWWTLHKVLKTVLKGLAPIVPFITDYIYRGIYEKPIHQLLFAEEPEIWNLYSDETTQALLEFNSFIWSEKKSAGISLREKVAKAYLSEAIKPFEKDLIAMHNIQEESESEFTDSLTLKLEEKVIAQIELKKEE